MHRVSLVAGVGARGFEESGERRACERRLFGRGRMVSRFSGREERLDESTS